MTVLCLIQPQSICIDKYWRAILQMPKSEAQKIASSHSLFVPIVWAHCTSICASHLYTQMCKNVYRKLSAQPGKCNAVVHVLFFDRFIDAKLLWSVFFVCLLQSIRCMRVYPFFWSSFGLVDFSHSAQHAHWRSYFWSAVFARFRSFRSALRVIAILLVNYCATVHFSMSCHFCSIHLFETDFVFFPSLSLFFLLKSHLLLV